MRRATGLLDVEGTKEEISIHALHEESDWGISVTSALPMQFQSTLSMRRATPDLVDLICADEFQSTLSMRRATVAGRHSAPSSLLFQSTLSMRRATVDYGLIVVSTTFQSTLSMRRATARRRHVQSEQRFQSTLSMRRATNSIVAADAPSVDFNPRSP